jgi:archaellum component FlaC
MIISKKDYDSIREQVGDVENRVMRIVKEFEQTALRVALNALKGESDKNSSLIQRMDRLQDELNAALDEAREISSSVKGFGTTFTDGNL